MLLVVVDTEEEFDWTAAFDRGATGVEHMRDIGKLQALFDDCGIRPTYVVDYAIATQETSAAPLRAFREAGRAEVGVHLHPWVSPPHLETVSPRNSYAGNLPSEVERQKFAELVTAIERGIGGRPLVYKAGRYGFGPNTAAMLEEKGFEVDLSVRPPYDFRGDGGPDYSRFDAHPFWRGSTRTLMSIPATGAYVGYLRSRARAAYRFATRPALAWAHLPAILARTGVLERLHLSPEGFSFSDNCRLTRALFNYGLRTFAFSFHSPSIRPGCTPYVRTQRQLDQLMDDCRRYFEFFMTELGGVNLTALEMKRKLAGLHQRVGP